MTEYEYIHKVDELDRLLNDPDVPIEPAKVWSLLAEISRRDGVAVEPNWQVAAKPAHVAL